MNDLLRRQTATQKTLDKYRDKPFSWEKSVTCVHLLRFHLKQLGYTPEPIPRIRSLLAARRVLEKRGCKNVGDLLDGMLPRITPASMLLGDVAMLDSLEGIGAIVISLGGKVMGWHEDAPGMTALEPLKISGAWRV